MEGLQVWMGHRARGLEGGIWGGQGNCGVLVVREGAVGAALRWRVAPPRRCRGPCLACGLWAACVVQVAQP